MKRIPLGTLLRCTTVMLGGLLLTSTPAEAHDWLGDCVVDFDNTFALTYIYGQAEGTSGTPPASTIQASCNRAMPPIRPAGPTAIAASAITST